MKIVKTRHPSFPNVKFDELLKIKLRKRWQVLCGDKEHYRVGIYSPEYTHREEIKILEKHDCPELFMLIDGEMSLLIIDDKGKEKVVKLKPLRPIFVKSWHNGFCPNGKYGGVSIVVERDEFTTYYKSINELKINPKGVGNV
ncbi:MAG: hypothetical protein N2746_11280 [Deltaproteobacteria bacterium]|nr:hypothetical protein [Deltaproteobacteria bacterium]